MFSFLKRAARAAAAGQCHLNISINTRTLIELGNQVHARSAAVGAAVTKRDQDDIFTAQKRLFEDIALGVANGMKESDVVDAIHKAAEKHGVVSDSARLAVNHVINSAFPG